MDTVATMHRSWLTFALSQIRCTKNDCKLFIPNIGTASTDITLSFGFRHIASSSLVGLVEVSLYRRASSHNFYRLNPRYSYKILFLLVTLNAICLSLSNPLYISSVEVNSGSTLAASSQEESPTSATNLSCNIFSSFNLLLCTIVSCTVILSSSISFCSKFNLSSFYNYNQMNLILNISTFRPWKALKWVIFALKSPFSALGALAKMMDSSDCPPSFPISNISNKCFILW